MITTAALPTKREAVRCTACGLTSRPPIVVPLAAGGRCSNRVQCDRRVLRAANAKKAQGPAAPGGPS